MTETDGNHDLHVGGVVVGIKTGDDLGIEISESENLEGEIL